MSNDVVYRAVSAFQREILVEHSITSFENIYKVYYNGNLINCYKRYENAIKYANRLRDKCGR